LSFDDDNATEKTLVPFSVWGAFRALGLEFDRRREPYRPLFDEVKLRKSAGYQRLWSVDFPLDQLLSRGCSARFGWIKKQYLIDITSVALYFIDHGPGYLWLSENENSGVWPPSADIFGRFAWY
jgi:hypothetical protein